MKDYNLKAIKQEFKDKGIYYTPPELAEYIKSLIDCEYDEVYDPTCGRGELLKVFPDDIKKYGQDINENEVEVAKSQLKNFTGEIGDTLANPAFVDKKFKAIVANPPFSIKWEPFIDERFEKAPCVPTKSKADYAFILHILHMLDNAGVAVVMGFPGILYRENREGKIRKWLIEQNWVDKVISVPGKKFTDTAIATCILVFKKNRTSQNITFIDLELDKQAEIPIKELDGSVLSVSRYVYEEPTKEDIDPWELECKARADALKKLEQDIKISIMVAKIEGWEFDTYLDDIMKVANKYK